MFIIILLEVLRKFNFTIDIHNLDEFIKTLKSQLHKNQILEQDEEARMLAKFFEAIKKKQELESEQIAKKIEDENEFNR
ncbi:hypothetical protein [Aliarcobacter cryaerophilus]|uniref:hypothetical protein n=1 Tax=Aliarcobacter cryaerophilus TaxID=28198 RepID=UPI0021B36596|nr:hypothetical protein [Aliarcobacter cryaerophilus]MCT7513461.1 hypothetical protein [Aliarcobacter cryaerophilus]